jgi:molybdopterin synthase catalytic subunit
VQPRPPADLANWIAVIDGDLPAAEASSWAVLPTCGAVVSFAGTSRDHSGAAGTPDERRGVTAIDYEVWDEQAGPRLAAVADEARRRWPALGRVALLHRRGTVAVGQASVVVVVSAPHRDEAFRAARFAIDAVKATVPVWKREVWPGGAEWGVDAHPIDDLSAFAAGPDGPRP